MSILPYSGTHTSFPFFEGSYSTDDYDLQAPQALSSHSSTTFDSGSFYPAPVQPAFPTADWSATQHTSWNVPLDAASMSWDAPFQPSYASSSGSSQNPSTYVPSFGCDVGADFEAYSPPSTTSSEVGQSSPFEHILPYMHSSGLPPTPSVPSSSQETQSAPRHTRRPSKESIKNVVERKYACDFCPVEMARLHDINRHMRIHTGVHPYACIGCGETFRRTDARTRHWCKSPECFNVHNAKAPLSKVRRRIP